VALEVFNPLAAEDSNIEYFYPSRLPGEPAEGVEDLHFHLSAVVISGLLALCSPVLAHPPVAGGTHVDELTRRGASQASVERALRGATDCRATICRMVRQR